MTELVDPEQIEDIVGARRHEYLHVLYVDSEDGEVYILHSYACRETYGEDLNDCPFSESLDLGLYGHWLEDEATFVVLEQDVLVPWSPSWNQPDPVSDTRL